GRLLHQVAGGLEGRPTTDDLVSFPVAAVAPDHQHLAVPCRDGAVRMLSLPDLTVRTVLKEAHHGAVNCVTFSPDGRWFASGGEDRIVVLWDGRTFQKLLAFPRHVGAVTALAFDRRGSLLAAGGREQQVSVLELDRLADGLMSVGLGWAGAGHQGV